MKALAFAIQVKAFPSSPKNVHNKGSNAVHKEQSWPLAKATINK